MLTDGEGKEEQALEMDDEGRLKIARPKISGKIKLTYDEDTEREKALEVDADAYMAELRGQVRRVGEGWLCILRNAGPSRWRRRR